MSAYSKKNSLDDAQFLSASEDSSIQARSSKEEGPLPQPPLEPHPNQSEACELGLVINELISNKAQLTVLPTEDKRNDLTAMALPKRATRIGSSGGQRLNKFVSRLHAMITSEKDAGIVQWRHGLLVLHDTDTFAKEILPRYFNTKNFKTFRRQLNYYGFVHVRSFSNTGASTTALWVNRELAKTAGDSNHYDPASVLLLKRVEPCESAKTAEGRRIRKELAMSTVENGLGVSPKSLQVQQIRTLGKHDVLLDHRDHRASPALSACSSSIPTEISCPTSMSDGSYHRSDLSRNGSNESEAQFTKPPTSSASVANLLLLLSKA